MPTKNSTDSALIKLDASGDTAHTAGQRDT